MRRIVRTAAAAAVIVSAAVVSRGAEERTPSRTLAHSESDRVYACTHYYEPYEKSGGKTKVTVREARTRARLLTLGAEVDLDATQLYFSAVGSSKILGFALRQKTREVEQVTEGALTPGGFMCRVTRDGEVTLKHTVQVPPETIIPYDMSFIPRLVRRAGGKGGNATILSVESLALVEMSITPAGTETVTVGGRERRAARFNVVAGSSGMPEALRMRHRLYFDPKTDEMLLSVQDDPSRKRRRRGELARRRVENALRRLRQRGDELRPRRLPWAPGEGATYAVQRDGVKAGAVVLRLEKAPGDRLRLVSKRTLGADTEEVGALVTPGGLPVSYALAGRAKFVSATGEPVEKPYSLKCTFEPARITQIYEADGKTRRRSRVLDGKVYVLDRNAPGLFAIIASQLELKLGSSATVGVYHARDAEAALVAFTVVSSGQGVRGPYYVVHVRGRTWMGTMTVSGDGRLLRADRRIGGSATLEYILER